MTFTLWGTLSNFFSTAAGPIVGVDWSHANEGGGGDPVWFSDETSAAGFVAGDPAPYDIDLTAQNWLGDQQDSTITVATTTLVDPFGTTGALGFVPIFSTTKFVSSGAAVWWQASATPGDYDLEFEALTDSIPDVPTATPAISLSGNVVALETAIAHPTHWLSNSSSTALVLGYSTAVTGSTENIEFQAFNTDGQATSPLVQVATDVSDSTPWYIYENDGNFYFEYAEINGLQTGVYFQPFNTATGALGAPIFVNQDTNSNIFSINDHTLSTGNDLLFIEGMVGQHDIRVTLLNSAFVPQQIGATFALSGTTSERWSITSVYDPNTGHDDYTALAYDDAGEVHLELLDDNGHQIGTDFVVPGLTSFDSIHNLGSRVIIDYSVPDASNGGSDILGYIYDTATAPDTFTLTGSNEYVGTPFDDTVTDAPGINSVNGGGGTDTFVVNYSTSQVSVSIDAAGSVHVATPDSTDRLERFTYIDLLNATITLTTNVTDAPYSAYDTITSSGQVVGVDDFFTAVSGQPFSSYEYDYNGGNDFVGSKFYYTGVTGQAYTGYEYDYDGGGHVTRADFTGVSGAAYSSYEYDYTSGVYAGAKFEGIAPAGASYSSYETDYNFVNQFTGAKFYFANITGQSYTGEEEDLDANGALARVLLTGVTGQAYSSLEEDFSAGSYVGYKAFYTISGQSYTGVEIDASAENVIAKAVYTGFTGTPYSSVEEDFSGGALTSTTYDFTNQSSQSFSAYQAIDDSNGNPLQEIVDNNDGSHTIVGFQSNQTFTSIGNDTMTGGGANETFVFNPAYGHDTITDLAAHLTGAGHDTISLSTSEFANIAAVLANVQDVGSNAVITGANGDTITLDNVTTSTLTANQGDFTFHA